MGLITFDRKTKKDAFYFHKANWSEEPVLHITSSRYIFREKAETKVKVYTNLTDVTLKVNGNEFLTKSPEKGIITWDGIILQEGNNGIVVSAVKDRIAFTDDCVWVLENPYQQGSSLFINIFDFMMIVYKVVITGIIAAFFVWLFGIRKVRKGPGWKIVIYWTVVIVLLTCSILILGAKFFISNMMGG